MVSSLKRVSSLRLFQVIVTIWFSTIYCPVAYRSSGVESFCGCLPPWEMRYFCLSSNHHSRACSLLLNVVANELIKLSVPQTITSGDTIPVNWNRGIFRGNFTLGLYRASASGLDHPLATTVVPDSAENSGVANLKSSPNATGCVPSVVHHLRLD
jgi:hypothetical protein